MPDIATTRQRLTALYEKLSALDQAIVQLCSVIYMPVNEATVFEILLESGIFPVQELESLTSLGRRIFKLQELKFLDRKLQCPEAFVEVASRRALKIPIPSRLPDPHLLVSTAAWSRDLGHGICALCGKTLPPEPAFKGPSGWVCRECAVSELRAFTQGETIKIWPISRFIEALSTGGDVVSRLTVLWRFKEALRIIKTGNAPAEIDTILSLAVRNMGHLEGHPLDPVVRQAALEACVTEGEKVLRHILENVSREPWQYYANLVMAAGTVAPKEAKVRKLLEEASRHPNPEVRKRVLSVLIGNDAAWSRKLIHTLYHDPDPIVRELLDESEKRAGILSRGKQAEDQKRHFPSNRFQLFAEIVQEKLPTRWYSHESTSKTCQQGMRELRIALYTQEMEQFRKAYNYLQMRCSKVYIPVDPLLQICSNPFDPEWFRTLPIQLQVRALVDTFYRAIFDLTPDADELHYALEDHFLESLSGDALEPAFYHHLVSRLIVGGQLKDTYRLLERIGESSTLYGISGWLHLIEGNSEAALTSFEADLKELKHEVGKKKGYFGGLEGLFYAWALLTREDSGSRKKTRAFIDSVLKELHEGSPHYSCLKSLEAVLHAENFEPHVAREILTRQGERKIGLVSFFHLLAEFWTEGRLNQEQIDLVSKIFMKSRELGINWLATECAELLCRSEENTPVRRNFIENIQSVTGMKSLVAGVRIEESWKKRLHALRHLASPATQSAAAVGGSRLAWLAGYHDGTLSLKPLEQKYTVKGSWSKGRAVALSRLFGVKRPEFLTPQDHAICNAIEREGNYYGADYRLNITRALPAVVGHPLLFLEDGPGVRVEVVKGEPEVLVTRTGEGIHISFSPTSTDSRISVIQETPTRFRVVELSEEHQRIARIISKKGLRVPAGASEEVLDMVAGISPLVTVHSAIGGNLKDMVETEADATPRIHLVPSGPGLRLEMLVQPLGEGGPFLKPGQGMENLIAEVGGRLLHTHRDLAKEERMAEAVEASSPALTETSEIDRQWVIEDPQACLQVLLDLKALQERGDIILAWPEGEKFKVTREISFDRLRLKIHGKTDWFEVSGELEVDDGRVIDMKKLLELLQKSGERFIPLGEGEFLAITRELRKRLEEIDIYTQRHGKELRMHPLAALAIEDFTDRLPHFDADSMWKERLNRIRSGLNFTASLPSTLKATLRDYQVEGYQWLAKLARIGLGACLADDMGLGKTLQALAAILDRAPGGPALVVAPVSVCMNWVSEADRFAPTLNVTLLGNGRREEIVRSMGPMDVLVTSYGLLIQETELLGSISWSTIVLDEAQAIKNVETKRAQAAMKLNGAFKMITTGTPVENHLSELWTLFNFINPGVLGSRQKFNERFAVPIERYDDRGARKRLKKLIQPFILRRTKAQVLEELPPRTETILQVELNPEEEAFYEALRRQALERIELDDAPMPQKHLKILAEIMRLRQACCHPRLVVPESTLPSSKLQVFSEVVDDLIENGHKALVFSQFVRYLDLIREILDAKGIDYRYLDGSTLPLERKRQVDLFQAGHGDLFLISLRAGGLGLNLTAADYVIHMDPWWNPAVEDQASDRAHRIGQVHPVTVYRLVARHTIEEKIVRLHQDKRDLAGSLLDGSDLSGKMSAEELFELISSAS